MYQIGSPWVAILPLDNSKSYEIYQIKDSLGKVVTIRQSKILSCQSSTMQPMLPSKLLQVSGSTERKHYSYIYITYGGDHKARSVYLRTNLNLPDYVVGNILSIYWTSDSAHTYYNSSITSI